MKQKKKKITKFTKLKACNLASTNSNIKNIFKLKNKYKLSFTK